MICPPVFLIMPKLLRIKGFETSLIWLSEKSHPTYFRHYAVLCNQPEQGGFSFSDVSQGTEPLCIFPDNRLSDGTSNRRLVRSNTDDNIFCVKKRSSNGIVTEYHFSLSANMVSRDQDPFNTVKAGLLYNNLGRLGKYITKNPDGSDRFMISLNFDKRYAFVRYNAQNADSYKKRVSFDDTLELKIICDQLDVPSQVTVDTLFLIENEKRFYQAFMHEKVGR
jgi:hypothetical protein